MTTPLEDLRAAVTILRDTAGCTTGLINSDNQELLALVAVLLRLREPAAAWLEAEAERLATTAHPDWHDVIGAHALAAARAVLTTVPTGRPGPAEPGPIIDNARTDLARRMGVTP